MSARLPRLELEASRAAHEELVDLLSQALDAIAHSNMYGLTRILQLRPDLVLHRHNSQLYSMHNQAWNEGDTLCHYAARHGFTNAVEMIVEECGADVNAQSGAPFFEQPLHLAAESDKTAIVDILLRNGAQSTALNHEALTPFMCACRAGSLFTAQKILDKGLVVDVNTATTSRRHTALFYSCASGLLKIVQELWARGAVPTTLDTEGKSILHAACSRNQLSVIKFLIKNGVGLSRDAFDKVPFDYITEAIVRYEASVSLLEFEASGARSGWKLRLSVQDESFNWFRRTEGFEEEAKEPPVFAIRFDQETEEEAARRHIRERQSKLRHDNSKVVVLKPPAAPLFSLPYPPKLRSPQPVERVVEEKIDVSRFVV